MHLHEENLRVNQRRFDLGGIGEFDLARAKTELATSRADAIGLRRQRTTAEHAWSSRSWVLGALLSGPFIDGGRNQANEGCGEAALEESVAAYRQSVLVAFSEVEDNLAGLRILAGEAARIDDAVASARRTEDLARKLCDAGRSRYLDLLDARRNLAAVERRAVQLRGDRAVTTVALVRSLGGWDAPRANESTQARN